MAAEQRDYPLTALLEHQAAVLAARANAHTPEGAAELRRLSERTPQSSHEIPERASRRRLRRVRNGGCAVAPAISQALRHQRAAEAMLRRHRRPALKGLDA